MSTLPYRSKAQQRFFNWKASTEGGEWAERAHHWNEATKQVRRGKKKGFKAIPERVSKVAVGEIAKPLAIGTTGSFLANQIPLHGARVARPPKTVRQKKPTRASKPPGTIQKVDYADYVHSDDPDFNHVAAKKAFDLVMKMDDDSAEMFTYIVVSDLFEETVEKNLRTLQRHLDETIAKQLANLKKAHLRLVAKGYDHDRAVAYAQTIALLERQISKADNDPWKPEEHPRGGVNPGWFRSKVTHNQTRPLHEKAAHSIVGTKTPTHYGGEKLTPEQQARFQDEYRQVADFLSAVDQSTGPGGADVMLHYRDAAGRRFTTRHLGTKPPKGDLADPSTILIGMEARPTTVTAGGAAFGLSTALGGQMSAQQVQGINAADQASGKFTEAWLNAGDQKASNAKLYSRLAASGQFLQAAAPGNTKAQMAGRFAEIIGSHGPEAEAVLGPSARKTAYRYRGTEKAPSRQLVRAYGEAIQSAKQHGVEPEQEEELRRPSGRGVSTGSMVAAGARTRQVTPKAKGAAPTPLHRQAAARQALAERPPTWQERDLGRQVAVQYLRSRMPNKSLYELQLASGNTPPSEGIMLNKEGQIVSQAVGYGDDHYLPFNLKNLKALKGGEYIRTRSVGGLTAEDVYTGLMSGARQVTVTSRSGTYTMTFSPDFRGGRRYNDKARRMTRRYEQILDAVQSQQVDRMDIDPEMRQQIENEVKEDMPLSRGWKRSDQQDAIKERVDEFKQNPYITEQDEKRAEAIIASRGAGASDREKAKIRSDVYDELMEQKEVKFRLNSLGYKAAQDALQEQFPYYLAKPKWTPPRNTEQRIGSERDLGYVEPGRNRPTAAQAGLFGTVRGKSGKFSAAEADYQGARAVARGGSAEVGTAHAAGEKKGTEELTDKEKRAAAAQEIKRDQAMVTTAKKIQALGGARLDDDAKDLYSQELNYTEDDLRDPNKLAKFNAFASWLTDEAKDPTLKRQWESAVGHREAKPYSRERATVFPKVPATFEERAYQPGADDKRVARALDEIDRKTRESPIHRKPYSAMSEGEHQELHNAFTEMIAMLDAAPGTLDRNELEKIGVHPNSPGISGLTSDKEKILDRMELQQRARTLTSGMTDQQRASRESRTVVHGQTKTQEEYEGPAKQALKNAEYIDTLRRQVENLPGDHDEDTARLRGLADAWRNAVDEGDITTESDLTGFTATHQDEMAHVDRIERKLRGNQ